MFLGRYFGVMFYGLLNVAIQFDNNQTNGLSLRKRANTRTSRPLCMSGIMAKVEIYTSMMCPYCSRAVGLLQAKNVRFEQIDVSMSSELRQTMRSRAGGRTSVPQIFIDDEHIGGCDDLFALESAGHLDALLNQSVSQ